MYGYVHELHMKQGRSTLNDGISHWDQDKAVHMSVRPIKDFHVLVTIDLTFEGFMMFKGSIAFLTVRISSTVSSPSSSVRYSFFPTPTPCSPVPDSVSSASGHLRCRMMDVQVPSREIARWTRRWTASLTFGSSSSLLKMMRAWKFPSPT